MKLRRKQSSGGAPAPDPAPAGTTPHRPSARKRGRGQQDPAGGEPTPRELITPKNTKRAIAVGKVLVPVLTPIAMQLAGTARGLWDERRARRLGVPAGELSRYSGKGGALHARISRVAATMNELARSAQGGQAAEVQRFVTTTTPRLADLSAAIRAAELMPAERRRAAHKAVAGELDHIEPRLLALLGVGGDPGATS